MLVRLASIPGSILFSINSELPGMEGWIQFGQLPMSSRRWASLVASKAIYGGTSDKGIRTQKDCYLKEKYKVVTAWHREEEIGSDVEQWEVEISDEELLTHEREGIREYAVERLKLC